MRTSNKGYRKQTVPGKLTIKPVYKNVIYFQHEREQPDSRRTSPTTELILTTGIKNAIHSQGGRNEDQRPLKRDHEGYTELNQNAYMYTGYVCIFYTCIAHTQLMYV